MSQLEELVARMLELDENQLVLRLGISVKDISENLEGRTRSASIEAIDISTPILTRDEDTLNFGKRLFERLNAASYDLLCKKTFDDSETLKQVSESTRR